ncbi:unnamed protein product [Meganyctiphanes norvegica]|uniref:CUB domain-containing protein n=1 Tax=Meganyctiphanes norvegica TaxID=48144 RepID=A0AAV2S436_MEGNR
MDVYAKTKMLRIALFLGLGLGMLVTTTANSIRDSDPITLDDTQAVGTDLEGRDHFDSFPIIFQKFIKLPMINIFKVDPVPCMCPISGANGICHTEQDCMDMGGFYNTPADEESKHISLVSHKPSTCGGGHGVCCRTNAVCGDTITASGTYFTSPTSPYGTAGVCSVDLAPTEGCCKVMLEFETFDLLGPIEGECTNDTFVVVGANSDTEIPVLCGENGGQHMYIDIDNSEGPFHLIVTTSDTAYLRDWKIKVTYVPCGGCPPNRCLQYHPETTGSIKSFAYPTMLNNQKYAICFGYVPGYCDIGVDFTRFDLGAIEGPCTSDFVAAGTEKFCGDFMNFTMQANATAGPISLMVMSDDDGERVEEGFSGTYTMMGC